MKNKNVFEKNAKIPDVVQQKANAAFATIYNRQDEPEAKPQKIHGSPRAKIIKIASTVVVAAVTVAVLCTAIAYFAGKEPEMTSGSGEVTIYNFVEPFTIRVCAAELEPASSLPISLDVSHQSFAYAVDWEGWADFQINFPITVEGDNISSVTFKTNNAVIEVVSIDCPSIVKSGSTKTLPDYKSTYVYGNDMSGNPIGKTEVGYYDQFSADYSTLQNSKYLFNVCNVLTNRMDIYYLYCYEFKTNEDRCAAYTYLIKDAEVTVEVTFADGTTASRTLGLFCKLSPAIDKLEDGTEYQYDAMQVFCYDKNATDDSTKQLISDQIARATEIYKSEEAKDKGMPATTNEDEPVDNTDATETTETTVSTESTVSAEPSVSAESSASTEGTESTEVVSSSESTDSTGSDN